MSKESSFKIKTMLATAQPNLQLRAIDLNFLGDDGKASPSRGLKQAVLVSGDDDRQNVQDYAATVRSQYKKLDLQEVADEVTRANAQFRPIPFTRDAIKAIYYGAFVQGNVTRDEFLGIVSLAPTPISISGILGLVASYLSGQQIENGELLIKAKCEDGSLKYFSDTKEPPCAVKFASLSWTSDSLITERSFAVADDHFPISPFFFTSFALSLLFYFSLFIVGMGVLILRFVCAVFSTPYVETKKPFSLLSLVVFAVFAFIFFVVRLVIG